MSPPAGGPCARPARALRWTSGHRRGGWSVERAPPLPAAPLALPGVGPRPYGVWDAETEDLSPRGCRIITPRPQTVGTLVRLTITSERVLQPLIVTGRIVWVATGKPLRAGILLHRLRDGRSGTWRVGPVAHGRRDRAGRRAATAAPG